MPLNQPIQKRYFTISEVAKMLDIRPSTLRFWEKEFKKLQPKTNARGKRAYKHISGWTKAVQKARKQLKVKGFVAVKKGSALYKLAKDFYGK